MKKRSIFFLVLLFVFTFQKSQGNTCPDFLLINAETKLNARYISGFFNSGNSFENYSRLLTKTFEKDLNKGIRREMVNKNYLGPSFGVNLNFWIPSNKSRFDSSIFNLSTSTNVSFGLDFEHFFSNKLSIVSGIYFNSFSPKLRLAPAPDIYVVGVNPIYRNTQIPLALNYRLLNRDKFSFKTGIGISLNRLSLSTLRINLPAFEGNYEGVVTPNLDLTDWEPQYNYGVMASIGLERYITSRRHKLNLDLLGQFFPLPAQKAVYDYTVSGDYTQQGRVVLSPINYSLAFKTTFHFAL
ncbi:MAG: hypothetical protein ACXW1A_04650 [Nitrososphaeraceae archaeon]